jgi:hypothetical protein
MTSYKILRHDLRCGLLRRRFLLVPLITLIPLIEYLWLAHIYDVNGTTMDMLIYIFKGVASISKLPGTPCYKRPADHYSMQKPSEVVSIQVHLEHSKLSFLLYNFAGKYCCCWQYIREFHFSLHYASDIGCFIQHMGAGILLHVAGYNGWYCASVYNNSCIQFAGNDTLSVCKTYSKLFIMHRCPCYVNLCG